MATTEMDGTYVKVLLQDTGQINTDNGTGIGIKFRPDLLTAFGELLINSIIPAGCEAWVLTYVTEDNGFTLNRNGGADQFLLVGTPTITNLDSGSLLKRQFVVQMSDTMFGSAVITLTQIVSFDMADKRFKIEVSLHNEIATTITGLTYLRTVNPLQALNAGGDGTDNSSGIDVFPTGVAVKSLIPTLSTSDPDQRLICLATDIKPPMAFSYVNASGNALSNNDITLAQFANNNDRLNADSSITTTGSPYTSDPGTIYALNLWFDTIPDMGAGDTVTLEPFYYIFDFPPTPPPSTTYGLWKAYFKGFVSGEDMIAGAFGIPTEFEPTMGTNQVLIMQMDAVDINGWAAGLPGIFKLERDATDARDTDTGDQSVLAIELIYDRV